MKLFTLSLSLAVASMLFGLERGNAIDADLAKECRAAAIKAHPYQHPGVKTGTAAAQRAYYQACIANNGSAPAEAKSSEKPAK